MEGVGLLLRSLCLNMLRIRIFGKLLTPVATTLSDAQIGPGFVA